MTHCDEISESWIQPNFNLTLLDGLRSKVDGQVIAIDGKTVRGSTDKANGRSAIHMVSA